MNFENTHLLSSARPAPSIDYSNVTITKSQPKARLYGEAAKKPQQKKQRRTQRSKRNVSKPHPERSILVCDQKKTQNRIYAFEVPFDETMSVFDAIGYIKDNPDKDRLTAGLVGGDPWSCALVNGVLSRKSFT